MRYQRLALVSFVTLFATALPAVVSAQIDTERFKPPVTYDGWTNAEGSAVRGTDDRWEFGAYLNYQANSLVITDASGDITRSLVEGRAGLDLVASATLFGPLALGLSLPTYFAQTGDVGDPSFAGIGDLRIVPKLRLLDDRDTFGLAAAFEVRVPTNTGDYSGSDGVTLIPKVIADHMFRSGLRLGFNGGVAIRQSETLQNIEAGSEIIYDAAIGYRIGGIPGSTEFGVEGVGAVGLEEADAEEAPLEAFVYLRYFFNQDWQIIGGPSFGIIEGYGVPTMRGFVGVRFTPTSHDRDGDGVDDSQDQCPDDAEDRDGTQDSDGCPDEDPDGDRDGVADYDDLCPNAQETINGIDDEDGCPDTGDPRVIYEEGEFQVLEPVRFRHGSAELDPESHGLLNQVALMMKANPDLKHIRVEGHTDMTGPEDVNKRLSEERARSVRRYLVDRGVAPNRLRAEGYGEERPVISGETEEANAKNRRVEFRVED
jgi:outer membrane protein OmpA-like peptidoglycan-associated protein